MSLSLDTASCGNNITVEGSASLLTYDCHRTVPAPFLTKTYHLVDDPATDDIVSWGEDETTFVVWRPPEFARDLLPNYFKHNNFSSFVRQLNTYGFRKIVPDHWEFANKFFRRGEKQLLCEIHRRKSSQYGSGASDVGGAPGSQSASPTNSSGPEDQGGPWSPFPSPLSSPSTILLPQGASTLMSDENERLRHDNRMLLLELSRLRRLYDDLVLILQQQSKVSLQAELPNSSRLHTLGDHKATISEQIEAAARRSELLRFKDSSLRPPSVESAYLTTSTRSDTPRASTLSFLDGKLREMASASGMASTSSSPKLFGVSLQNVKPWSSSQEAVAHKRPWGVDGSVEGGPPKPGDEGGGSSSRKGMKVELGLELSRPGIMSRERPVDQEESGQPWLRISATESLFM